RATKERNEAQSRAADHRASHRDDRTNALETGGGVSTRQGDDQRSGVERRAGSLLPCHPLVRQGFKRKHRMFTWPSVAADRPLPKNMPAWSYQLKRWPQEARLGEWCPSFEAQNHRRWHSTNSRARSVQTESSRKDTVEPQSGCPALQAASETEDRPRDVRVVAEQEKCALYIPQLLVTDLIS